jgi:Arc/MetJ family transcription regulator
VVYVTRTNIEIDDELITQVMQRHRLRTKREAVDYALRRLLQDPLSLDEALGMQGFGWPGDLAAMRDQERPGEAP